MKRVKVGKEFDAEVVRAKADFFDRKLRAVIAVFLLTFGGVASASAFLVGLVDGTFNELQGFWLAYGPILGALVAFYFRRLNAKD